jgi:hypothetical protein
LKAEKEKTNDIGKFLSSELDHTEHEMQKILNEIKGVSNLADAFEKVL